MDVRSLNRIVLISSSIVYTLNVILSISFYTLLTQISLPVSEIVLKSLLISVPLISGVYDAFILAMILMSLKYAQYYGIGKSVLTLVIYAGYWIIFNPPLYVLAFIIATMALCAIQIMDLYLYGRIQKEMFG